MRKLLPIFILLSACNEGVFRKTTADSAVTAGKTDTLTTAAAPAPALLSVELTGITEEEFQRHQPSTQDQIEYDTTKFRTVNGQLTLPTEKEGVVLLQNNNGVPHDEDRLVYQYRGYLKLLNKYLVEVNGYEHGYCLLIDKSTGKKDTISNLPVVSPDGRLILSKRYNPYEEHEHIPPPTEDISIYTVDNNAVKRIFLQANRWFAHDLYWKDNHTVYVKTWQKEGDDAAISDYVRLTVVAGQDTLNSAAVNASWNGTYATVLHESSDDARDHIGVELKVDGNTAIYTESGFQLYNKYLLAASEMDGALFFTFKKILDGGGVILKIEKRFGHIKKEDGKYILYCPYLDCQVNGGHRMSYPLKKK